MTDLDDFTAQLNQADGGPGQAPPGMNPEQAAALKAAADMKAQLDAKPLLVDKLKGKVDIKWYGHAGFKLGFKDKDDVQRSIYIDIWIDNKDCPAAEKAECPNDTDLCLVTHGQLDHSMHAPFLIMAGKKEERKIVCSSEVATYYTMFRRIPEQFMAKM